MYKWMILLFLVLVLILLGLYILGTQKESFTSQDLNINISADNQTISIPNNLKGVENTPLNFLGNVNVNGTASMDNLVSNNTTLRGTTQADALQIGEATLGYSNGLYINKPVNFQANVNVNGNLTVNGNICIQNGGNYWYIVVRNGYLHFVKNDPNYANYYDHRNNEPHVIISPDGNIWTSRQSFPGWIADSLAYINSINI
jgi:hypothetical protein